MTFKFSNNYGNLEAIPVSSIKQALLPLNDAEKVSLITQETVNFTDQGAYLVVRDQVCRVVNFVFFPDEGLRCPDLT